MSASGGSGGISAASVNASSTGGNQVNAATLPAVAAKTNYLTGFEVTAAGATAGAAVTVTVTGVAGGPLSYTFTVPAGAALAAAPLVVAFASPLEGSGVNVAIVVSCPALGAGNTNAAVSAHGFAQ